MGAQTQIMFDYLVAGELKSFFSQFANFYFPYGISFFIIGFVIFAVSHIRYKSLAFSGAIATGYFFFLLAIPQFVTNAYAQQGIQFFSWILAIFSIGYYFYEVMRE